MKILLIEDDKRLSRFIAEAFPSDEVVIAGTLQMARAILVTLRPVLILVDLALPDSEGMETLTALKEYSPPKVAFTAGQSGLSCEAAKLCADYVRKGLDLAGLLARVRFNVERYRPRARFEPETWEQLKACLTCVR